MPSARRKYYWAKDPNTGSRVKKRRSKWYARYKGEDGQWKERPGYTDKEATVRLARRLEKGAAQRREGIADPVEQYRATPLTEHLHDFRLSLESKNNGEDHVERTVTRIQKIIDGCNFRFIPDITGDRVANYLAAKRRAGGIGKQTSNYYLKAMRQFCRWLVRERRAQFNAIEHVNVVPTMDENSRSRRACTDEEFELLVNAAQRADDRHTVPGKQRAAIYILAINTGLRASKIASLAPESFSLGGHPTVTVATAYSKRRKRDTLPLHPEVAKLFHELIEGQPEGERLWPGRWHRRAAEMLKQDLKIAGIPYIDEQGQIFDFHAFRHTHITSLHRHGTYGANLQRLARHSTYALTERYTHTEDGDLIQAVGQLCGVPRTAATSRVDTDVDTVNSDDRNPLNQKDLS